MRILKPATILILIALTTVPFTCIAGQQESEVKQQQESTSFSNNEKVRSSLDNLIAAYSSKNISRFMSYVADDYTGDSMNLESTIRKNFSRFHNIEIRYTFNNITFTDKADKVSVGITFTRSQTVIKTGKISNQNAATVFVFKLVDGTYKLQAMKPPYLFGGK